MYPKTVPPILSHVVGSVKSLPQNSAVLLKTVIYPCFPKFFTIQVDSNIYSTLKMSRVMGGFHRVPGCQALAFLFLCDLDKIVILLPVEMMQMSLGHLSSHFNPVNSELRGPKQGA